MLNALRMVALIGLISLSGCAIAVETTSKPNIVMIIVDDLGRQDVGVYGSDFYETPNIDQLARTGIRYDNAYAAHARCVPSRLGIMSGNYPARYGIPGFQDRSLGKHVLPLSATTFAEELREAGYATTYIGKWHLGKEGGEPKYQGFDTSIMAGKAGAPPSYFFPYENSRRKSGGKGFPPYSGGDEGEYLSDRLTDEALAVIDGKDERPFLLVLAHYAVHTPIEAPEELTTKYKTKAKGMGLSMEKDADIVIDGTGQTKTQQNHPVYAAMIESVDTNVGRIMARLEETGHRANTVVIITSDHGGLSSRGLDSNRELATTNLPYRHGKGWLYDGGIRVPLIVNWPDGIETSATNDMRTTGTDHYATILDIAGIESRETGPVDSVSYWPTFSGETPDRPPMFWHSSLGRPTQTGDTRSSAVRDGQWKLIQWYSLENEEVLRVELFDLDSDPGERNNLADKHPETRARLETMLDEWKDDVNARLGRFKAGGV